MATAQSVSVTRWPAPQPPPREPNRPAGTGIDISWGSPLLLTGRHLEMETLRECIKAVRAGVGGLLLVRGAAGVGKSSLLNEGLVEAQRLGFRVLHARADELYRAVPYAAVREALSAALDAEHEPALLDLVDQVRGGFTAPPRGDSPAELLSDVRALHLALDGVERLLRAWSAEFPVLLAIDDLHAADLDTVTAVSLLVRTLRASRVLIAVTLRPDPPDLDAEMAWHIERLAGRDFVTVIDLMELDADDVRALVATRLSAQPDDELVDRVFQQSRGNPFYVEQVLRSHIDAGAVETVAGVARIGPTAQRLTVAGNGALLQRVRRLGSDAWTVARCLTAFQRVTLDRLSLVAQLSRLEDAAVDRAFDTLVRGRILIEVPDGGWEFAHPFLRATLDGDLGPAERHRLHLLVTQTLLAQRDSGRFVDPLELALHVTQVAQAGEAHFAEILASAGDLTAGFAPRSAAEWYERAIRVNGVDDERRGVWLAQRSRALFLAQRKAGAAASAQQALAVLPPGRERERAAVVLAGSLSALGRMEEALAVTDAELPAGEHASRLLAERATLLVQLDRFDEAEQAAERAVAEATHPGSRALAVSAEARVAFARGRASHAVRLLGAELEAVGDSPAASLTGIRIARASYLAYAGRCQQALSEFEQVEKLVAELGADAFRTSIDPPVVWMLALAGRWDEALDRARSTIAAFERSGELFLLPLVRAVEAQILIERGELGQARKLLDTIGESASTRLPTAWVRAAADAAVGRFDEARRTLEAAIAGSYASGRFQFLPQLRERLVRVELEDGRPAAAAAQLAALREEMACAVPNAWSLSLLARATARVTADAHAARDSAEIARQEGLVFEAAVSGLLVGELTDDAVALWQALEVFRALGATPWERRAKARLRAEGHRVPHRQVKSRSAMTATERDLARLVADGLTNREIAGAAHLSPKTVEAYLSRVYAKTGCASRVELAVAVKAGLLEAEVPVPGCSGASPTARSGGDVRH